MEDKSPTGHEGFEQDSLDYWTMRDQLLSNYYGKWVAVHKGKVTAVGDEFVDVAHRGSREEGYAYCNLVGFEDKVVVTKRRQFKYQTDYWPSPIPRIEVVASNPEEDLSKTTPLAIPDTGSDLSCLPEPVCDELDLYRFEVLRGATRLSVRELV